MKIDASEVLKLAADLEKAGDRVGARVAAQVKKSGNAVRDRGEASAPKGRTRKLSESIEVTFYGDGRSLNMYAVAGPTVRYGLFQERGTSRNAPHPFMGPALDAEMENFMAGVAAALGETLP